MALADGKAMTSFPPTATKTGSFILDKGDSAKDPVRKGKISVFVSKSIKFKYVAAESGHISNKLAGINASGFCSAIDVASAILSCLRIISSEQ